MFCISASLTNFKFLDGAERSETTSAVRLRAAQQDLFLGRLQCDESQLPNCQ